MKKLVSIFMLMVVILSCKKEGLTMSYSSADISGTPEEHMVLAGFAARDELSDGIHLPLYTHCLVVGDGAQKVCIISNDLMEISPAITDTLLNMIAERSGLKKENILMHCTHTHSAPRSGGASNYTGGTNRAWKERMMETVVANAVKAIKAKGEPFTLEIGKGSSAINGNRCEKDGPVDRSVYVARFLQGGKPVASIVNYSCHPVSMGPTSYLLSSDYPGVAARYLQEARAM